MAMCSTAVPAVVLSRPVALVYRLRLGKRLLTSPTVLSRFYHTPYLAPSRSAVGHVAWTCNLRYTPFAASILEQNLWKKIPFGCVQAGRSLFTYHALSAASTAATGSADAVTNATIVDHTRDPVAATQPVSPAADVAVELDATSTSASTHALDLSSSDTSAYSRWAADAADYLSELPAQGDLVSLGLGANTPVGWLQLMMEYLHVHAHLPWWGAIVASTILLRAVIFPVVMKVQKNGVVMNNINPELQKLMQKQKEYRQTGNKALADQYSFKIWNVYQKNNCNPLKMAILPLIQLPLFISFFIAIRRMAAVPVESMKTGGILWFPDLTTPDPYYVLPVLACASFVASIELGGETGVGNPQTAKLRNVFRLLPIIMIPITASFPAGLFMYWLPASFISIGQIMLLKVQGVRDYFGIPKVIQHPPEAQEKAKGVMGYFKESYSSSIAIAEAKQRTVDAQKRYKQMLKNPKPKLYDKPPHLRNEQ